MHKKAYFFLVLIGAISIFYLLVCNHRLYNKNKNLHLTLKSLESKIGNLRVENSLIHRRIVHPKIKLVNGEKIIALIPGHSCKDIESQISRLNNISKNPKINFKAFILAQQSSLFFLEPFGAEFSYDLLAPSDPIVEHIDTEINEPVYLVLGPDKIIENVLTFDLANELGKKQFIAEL